MKEGDDGLDIEPGLKKGWWDVAIILRYRGNVGVVLLRVLRRAVDDRTSCHQKDLVENPKGRSRD